MGPRNRPRRTCRVSGGMAQPFLNLGTRRGCVVSITPRPPVPPVKTRYPLYRRLAGPGAVWTGAENLASPGFDPRTFQPVASRYTDCAIPDPTEMSTRDIFWE